MKTIKNLRRNKYASGFTIVELLIVIVIIGILAAITVVSYTGITKKANESTLQADLATAKKQIALYYIDHGAYPTSLEDNTNCLKGTTLPSPDTRYCLKATSGSVFTLTDTIGTDYTLTLTKGTVAYKITKDLVPTLSTSLAVSVKNWGGDGVDTGQSLTRTSDGGYAVTGTTTSYGAGGDDVFLAKYDLDGNLIWNKTWGGADSDISYDLIQSSDNGYVVTGYTKNFGAVYYDMFIAKFDSNGSLLWNKTWGGPNFDYGLSITQTNDSGYAVTGRTGYGAGADDMFIAKYDSSGNLIWNKTWGGTNSTDTGYGIIQNNDGSYIVMGHTGSFGAGNADLFIVKYDSNGNLSWNKTWGGANNEIGYGITQTADGGFATTGYSASFTGSLDVFIVKYDSSGSVTWNKTWGGAGVEQGQSIVQTSDGGYAIAGSTNSYGAGNHDTLILKYDSNGNISWNKTWGGPSNDIGYGLAQLNNGNYSITGYTESYGVAGNVFNAKLDSTGLINNCISPMCQTPTATVTTPSATITTPSATVSSPTATITTPSATITSPTATITTVVAP